MLDVRNTKETEIKRNYREAMIEKLTTVLEAAPEFTNKVSRIKNGVAVAVDDILLEDGTMGEICILIKPTVPDYTDKINLYGEIKPAYERLKEEDAYYEEILAKEEKAKKIRKEKEERAEKLKIAKAERLRKKLEALETPSIQPPAMENLYPNLR